MNDQEKLFNFQLECIKKEMDLTERVIDRMDKITQTTKNWGIVVWLGVVAAFLRDPKLKYMIIFSGIVPLIFWFIDAWWLSLHRGAILRQKRIRQFINSKTFKESFDANELPSFQLFDPYGKQYKGTSAYKKQTNIFRIMRYKELMFLFGSLLLFSIGLQVVVAVWG